MRKTIAVQFKAEISRLTGEKEGVEEKLRDALDEKGRLTNQMNRLIGKPMDGLEKREELELFKEMRIQELEQSLSNSE